MDQLYLAKEPNRSSPYTLRLIEFLDRYGIGKNLNDNLSLITTLPESKSNEILIYFLELACLAQNMTNINNGRYCLQKLPINWLKERLILLEDKILEDNSSWVYLRLIELYQTIDRSLASKLANKALNQENPEIREVGEDYFK